MRQFCFTDSYCATSGKAIRYRVSREYELVSAPDFHDVIVAGFGGSVVPLYGAWVIETAPAGQGDYLVTSYHSGSHMALLWAFRGAGLDREEAGTAAAFAKWRHEEHFVEPMVLEEENPPDRNPRKDFKVLLGVLAFGLVALFYALVMYFFFTPNV